VADWAARTSFGATGGWSRQAGRLIPARVSERRVARPHAAGMDLSRTSGCLERALGWDWRDHPDLSLFDMLLISGVADHSIRRRHRRAWVGCCGLSRPVRPSGTPCFGASLAAAATVIAPHGTEPP